MSADRLDVGQVRISGRDAFADLNLVRTRVRMELYGRTDHVGAIVQVVAPDGSVEDWEFDEHIGYPINVRRDWLGDWLAEHT